MNSASFSLRTSETRYVPLLRGNDTMAIAAKAARAQITAAILAYIKKKDKYRPLSRK
jgi:hypothetical protein